MNAVLEQAVYKYLRPTDEPISLTDTAMRFESENPSNLIQSWLCSRNTIELKWMRILRFFAIIFFAFSQLMTFLTIFTIGIVSYEELVRDLNTEQKIELLQQYKDRFLQINGKYYCYNEGFCNFEFDNDNSLTLKM